MEVADRATGTKRVEHISQMVTSDAFAALQCGQSTLAPTPVSTQLVQGMSTGPGCVAAPEVSPTVRRDAEHSSHVNALNLFRVPQPGQTFTASMTHSSAPGLAVRTLR